MRINTYERLRLLFEKERQSRGDIYFKYYQQELKCSIIVERDNKMDHTTNSSCEFVFYNIPVIMKMYNDVKIKTKRNKFNSSFFKIKKNELTTELNIVNKHNMKLVEMLDLYCEQQDYSSLDYTLEILNYSRLENDETVREIKECFKNI